MLKKCFCLLLAFLLVLLPLSSQEYYVTEEQLQKIETQLSNLEEVQKDLQMTQKELEKAAMKYDKLLMTYEQNRKCLTISCSINVGLVAGIVIWRALK